MVTDFKTLLEHAPREFGNEFYTTEAYKYRNLKVVKQYKTHGGAWDNYEDKPWPGSHKNVYVWWELEDGHAVGWNENPSRGWSFPVIRLRRIEKVIYCVYPYSNNREFRVKEENNFECKVSNCGKYLHHKDYGWQKDYWECHESCSHRRKKKVIVGAESVKRVLFIG